MLRNLKLDRILINLSQERLVLNYLHDLVEYLKFGKIIANYIKCLEIKEMLTNLSKIPQI